jgi:hypothetical protein
MRTPIEIKQGEKYNRWTILKEIEPVNNRRYFECRCDCGNVKSVRLGLIRNGQSKSCGCLITETQKLLRTTHGRTGTLEYKSWSAMKERCGNPKNIKWNLYGGRGIIVCDRWLNSFQNFFNDMGPRPVGTTLDRINSNGNYEPSNCRWSTILEQNKNRIYENRIYNTNLQ